MQASRIILEHVQLTDLWAAAAVFIDEKDREWKWWHGDKVSPRGAIWGLCEHLAKFGHVLVTEAN